VRTRTCPACGRRCDPRGWANHCLGHATEGDLIARLVWAGGDEMTAEEQGLGPGGYVTRWAFRLPGREGDRGH